MNIKQPEHAVRRANINLQQICKFIIYIIMGIKSSRKYLSFFIPKWAQGISLTNEKIKLMNAKVLYKEADMWIAAEDTEKSIQEAYQCMETALDDFSDAWEEIQSGSKNRKESADAIRENNKKFANELLDTLEWGI